MFNVTTSLTRDLALAAAVVLPRAMDWSASGNRLAVVLPVKGGGSHIWVVPARGGEPLLVLDDRAALNTIRWSARGDALYYLRRDGDANELWRIAMSTDTGRTTGPAEAVMSGHPAGTQLHGRP